VSATEVITRVTPLGVRFVDEATATPVRDGLRVTYPSAAGRASAVATPSDVFAVRAVPGLRASEQGSGDEVFWAAPPATRMIRIEVDDAGGRFQPCSFSADVPFRGLLHLPCAELSGAVPTGPSIPLLSTPARVAPAGMAVVRAQLRDQTSDAPAAYAVLEVGADPVGPIWRGLADEQGRVQALLPYPPPPDGLAPGPTALTSASWEITVTVRYAPGAVSGPHPDLCGMLGQPTIPVLASNTLPPQPVSTWPLVYGQDSVLQTAGESESVLLVLP
jgi:hypothetical protein